MSSDADDASCSECNLELIEKKWTQLMLNWINRCVSPLNKTSLLSLSSLIEIIDRYKDDVCADELEYTLLSSNEVESFIKYKYPILRLRYLGEAKDYPKKLYIMTTILLYHCCANSQEGVIDRDICVKLDKVEQELILRFCENMSDMETTINNVDLAIQKAFEYVSRGESSIQPLKADIKCRNNEEATVITKLEVQEVYPTATVQSVKCPILKFKSSITVMPSVDSELSAYSKSDSSEPDLQYDNTKLEKVLDEKSTAIYNVENVPVTYMVEKNMQKDSCEKYQYCQLGCACERCSGFGPCCGTLGSTMDQCKSSNEKLKKRRISDRWRISKWNQFCRCCTCWLLALLFLGLVGFLGYMAINSLVKKAKNNNNDKKNDTRRGGYGTMGGGAEDSNASGYLTAKETPGNDGSDSSSNGSPSAGNNGGGSSLNGPPSPGNTGTGSSPEVPPFPGNNGAGSSPNGPPSPGNTGAGSSTEVPPSPGNIGAGSSPSIKSLIYTSHQSNYHTIIGEIIEYLTRIINEERTSRSFSDCTFPTSPLTPSTKKDFLLYLVNSNPSTGRKRFFHTLKLEHTRPLQTTQRTTPLWQDAYSIERRHLTDSLSPAQHFIRLKAKTTKIEYAEESAPTTLATRSLHPTDNDIFIFGERLPARHLINSLLRQQSQTQHAIRLKAPEYTEMWKARLTQTP